MKVLKYIIGTILTVVPCLVCVYLIQYPLYRFDARETPVYKAILLLAVCGVAVVLVYGGAALLNNCFESPHSTIIPSSITMEEAVNDMLFCEYFLFYYAFCL